MSAASCLKCEMLLFQSQLKDRRRRPSSFRCRGQRADDAAGSGRFVKADAHGLDSSLSMGLWPRRFGVGLWHARRGASVALLSSVNFSERGSLRLP